MFLGLVFRVTVFYSLGFSVTVFGGLRVWGYSVLCFGVWVSGLQCSWVSWFRVTMSQIVLS